jgi:hypothetical protein
MKNKNANIEGVSAFFVRDGMQLLEKDELSAQNFFPRLKSAEIHPTRKRAPIPRRLVSLRRFLFIHLNAVSCQVTIRNQANISI